MADENNEVIKAEEKAKAAEAAAEEARKEADRIAKKAKEEAEARKKAEEAEKEAKKAAEAEEKKAEEAAKAAEKEAEKLEEAKIAEAKEAEAKKKAEEEAAKKKAEEDAAKAAAAAAAAASAAAKKEQEAAAKEAKINEKKEKLNALKAQCPAQYKPVGTSTFFWVGILCWLPCIGFLISIILSIVPKNRNLKCFARSKLAYYLIIFIACMIITLVAGAVIPEENQVEIGAALLKIGRALGFAI